MKKTYLILISKHIYHINDHFGEYSPQIDNEVLEEIYSSYGMGFFKSKSGKFYFGSCHTANNRPSYQVILLEVLRPDMGEIKKLENGEASGYDHLWLTGFPITRPRL